MEIGLAEQNYDKNLTQPGLRKSQRDESKKRPRNDFPLPLLSTRLQDSFNSCSTPVQMQKTLSN